MPGSPPTASGGRPKPRIHVYLIRGYLIHVYLIHVYPIHVYPIRVCPMNTHGLNDKYERRVSPGGEVYYWAAGGGLDFRTTDEGSDVQELFKRCITVTPLRYDLTKKSTLDAWRERLVHKFSEE